MSEFKNENISLKVEKLPGTEIKLDILVSKEATKAAYAKAIKNVSKEILIPGFRKGKAPQNLVIEKFNSHIEDEWRNITLNTAFNEALKLIKTTPFSKESIRPQIKSISLDEGSSFIITFEATPQIPEITLKDIKLQKPTIKKVTEKDIEERLEELQLNQAKWEEISERGIEEGDFAHIDIESLETPGLMIAQNQPISIQKGKPGKWLYELLLGKKVGDVLEAISEKDPCSSCDHEGDAHHHHHHHEAEFKPSKLKISIKSIKKPELPEITADFASKLGAESIEKLRERVIQSLENNFKEEAQNNLREQIEKVLLERFSFDIPTSVLKAHEQNAHKKLDEKSLLELTNSYRMYLITQKIAHQQNFKLTEDEIMQEFMIQTYMTSPQNSIIDRSLDPKESIHRISSYLLEKKVKDYLIEQSSDGLKLLD